MAKTIKFIGMLDYSDRMEEVMSVEEYIEKATEKGYIGVPSELQEYIGKEGLAATILRPSGKVTIGDRQFDAVALHGYIEKGAGIKVVKYENAQLYVIEIK